MIRSNRTSWTAPFGFIGALAVGSASLVTGCDSPTTVCTQIGCDSGIEVQLEDPPTVPFRIEAEAPGGTARYVYVCDQSVSCAFIFFADFTPDRVFFEIIVGSDTTAYDVEPTYARLEPNGAQCGPTCFTAVVRLPSDGRVIGGG